MNGSKDDLEARVEAAQRLLREMEAALALVDIGAIAKRPDVGRIEPDRFAKHPYRLVGPSIFHIGQDAAQRRQH